VAREGAARESAVCLLFDDLTVGVEAVIGRAQRRPAIVVRLE